MLLICQYIFKIFFLIFDFLRSINRFSDKLNKYDILYIQFKIPFLKLLLSRNRSVNHTTTIYSIYAKITANPNKLFKK